MKIREAKIRTKAWARGIPVVFSDCGQWKLLEKIKEEINFNKLPQGKRSWIKEKIENQKSKEIRIENRGGIPLKSREIIEWKLAQKRIKEVPQSLL